MKHIIYTLVLIFLVSLCTATYDIDPTSFDFSGSPGEELEDNFGLTNTGSEDILFTFPGKIEFTSSSGNRSIDIAFDPPELILLFNSTVDIDFSFSIPSGMQADTYTGTLDLFDNESNSTQSYDLTLEVLPDGGFEIDTAEFNFGEVYYNETLSKEFRITNTGNTDLGDIIFTTNVDSKYQPKLIPESIDLLATGASKDIEFKIKIPFGDTIADEVDVGDILVNGEGFINLTMDVKSLLDLNKIRTQVADKTQSLTKNGEEIEEKAKPLEEVQLDVEVENLWDTEAGQELDIENVKVKITVIGIDTDAEDLEFESDEVDLTYDGNDRKHTFEFDFIVPKDAEDDTYEIETELTGTDEDDNDFEVIWTNYLNVDRDNHNLIINDYSINPSQLTCIYSTVIDFELLNLGKTDEDYVRYTVKNSQLNIDFLETRFEISAEVGDDENLFRVNIPLELDNPEPGTYPIELRIYRDFDVLEDVSGVNLVINQCGSQAPSPEPAPEPVEEPEPPTDVIQDEPEPELYEATEFLPKIFPVSNIPENQPQIVGQAVATSSNREAELYPWLLILGIFIMLALMTLMILLFQAS